MSVSVADPGKSLDIGKVLNDGLGVVARNFGPFFLLALLLEGIPSAVIAYARNFLDQAAPLNGASHKHAAIYAVKNGALQARWIPGSATR